MADREKMAHGIGKMADGSRHQPASHQQCVFELDLLCDAGFTRDPDSAAIAALAISKLDAGRATNLFARQLGDIPRHTPKVVQQNGQRPACRRHASVLSRHAADRAEEVMPSLDRDEIRAAAQANDSRGDPTGRMKSETRRVS